MGAAIGALAGIAPLISAGASIVGGIIKGVTSNSNPVKQEQQIPYAMTQQQGSIAQGLTQSLGQGLGQMPLGQFGGMPGAGAPGSGGAGMLGRIGELQKKLGVLTSTPPQTQFR